MVLHRVVLGISLCAGLCWAQPSNISGTWTLNVRKSSWGKKQKPHAITIEVQHGEPALAYSGVLVDMQGDGRHFELKCTIDGKEYPVAYQYGQGKIALRRLDRNTFQSLFTSNDGAITEETTTSISRSGKVLTHKVRLKDPSGEMRWTEIYDKR